MTNWISTKEANKLMDVGVCDKTFRTKFKNIIRCKMTGEGGVMRWDYDSVLACKGSTVADNAVASRDFRAEMMLKIDIDEHGCWCWQGWVDHRGYGPHRRAYELFRGSIPAGAEIHHICGNTTCLNPEHLEALTKEDHAQKHRNLKRDERRTYLKTRKAGTSKV